MQLRIISTGKFKNGSLQDFENDLLKRLRSSPFQIEQIELPGTKSASMDAETTKKREGEKILAKLKPTELVVVLDEKGKLLTSPKLADWLQQKMNSGGKGIAFIIGGAYGLDQSVIKRADLLLSLSSLTFPYQIARMILVEQLYRAASIISGSPYHKE